MALVKRGSRSLLRFLGLSTWFSRNGGGMGAVAQDLGNIESIGVDKIAWQKGHKYMSLVYQIDAYCKRQL
jgi:hypothetical protein